MFVFHLSAQSAWIHIPYLSMMLPVVRWDNLFWIDNTCQFHEWFEWNLPGFAVTSPNFFHRFHVSWFLCRFHMAPWFKMFNRCLFGFPKSTPIAFGTSPRRRHCGALSDCSTTRRQKGTDGMCQGHRQDGICQLEFLPLGAWQASTVTWPTDRHDQHGLESWWCWCW